ncbi:ribonuclease H-like domain-containing protein [Rhizophagus clarus]|uniref:Ribonuclease H-like domain-containing protein n=1 Tax=Rhizophagus clarus TaxID=94130 RepID=A0A8H3M2E8_9GLOM|nr:ribonuclease H-like domain-containing protein [Rhizophagus clarus]
MSAESSTLDNTNIILDDDLNYLNINLDNTSTILDDAENSIQRKLGKKKDKVWDYFNVIDIPNNPYKRATCKYCSQSWKRGKPIEMKSHLALRCPKVTHSIKMEYLYAMSSEDIPKQSTNNRKNNSNEIDIAKVNKTLIRFFVCCGIPFSVVDSPFFQDFVKSLCFEYELPKRTALSTTYLNEEAANILLKIEEELHESRNLTLAEFNEKQLLKVIEDVGKDKFIAVVSDGEAAIQSAKKRVTNKYSHIMPIRCIAHHINLVTKDIISIEWAKKTLQNCQKIVSFFHDVRAGAILRNEIKNSFSKGNLKSSVKTRWS